MAHQRKSIWQALCLGITLSAFLLVSFGGRAAAEVVPVWVYHDFPPYIVDIDREQGISYDLARHLNARADGRYTFKVEVLPRPRLNHKLAAGERGMVLWANPAWFGDPEQTQFLWTDPILVDHSVVISPKAKAHRYTGPDSLVGMTITGIRGHYYAGIDDLVSSGRMQRFDVVAENQLMHFIASGRGEVAIVAQSALQYFFKYENLRDEIHVAAQPHATFDRKILVQPQSASLGDFVQTAVADLGSSSEWSATIQSYGLHNSLIQ